jgi:hypothetical protein
MTDLERAVEQIAFARNYTVRLLDTVDAADWFRMPAEGVTHVAWQVGHLATAEYRLALERIRGRRAEDEQLIAEAFLRLFVRQSIAEADPSKYPSRQEIRAVFERVHAQTLRELPGVPQEALSEPLGTSHAVAKTKGEALVWCGRHEMIHAGQIGLLRRLFGQPPLW